MGLTGETLHACQAFKDAGWGDLITFSCDADVPLAAMGSSRWSPPPTRLLDSFPKRTTRRKAPGGTQVDVPFISGLDGAVRAVLYLLLVGLVIAFERSLSKGLNPNHPFQLDTVVNLGE